MNTFSVSKTPLTRAFLLVKFFLLILVLFPLFYGLTACKKSVDYFSYVSELRNNILLAETDGFSLKIYGVDKETPYATDGIPKEVTTRTEVYLIAPEGNETCTIAFTINGKEYGGEMSFDNVKTEYFLSCTLDISACSSIRCKITYGDQVMDMEALSVLKADTLTPQNVLNIIQTENAELFTAMTDKYGFSGEIYIRLIYEDAPYYYVGIIDRNGGIHAFLINATSGKILAKRES